MEVLICLPCIFGVTSVVLAFFLSTIVKSVAFDLQKSNLSDTEAKQRASTIAFVVFVLLAIIGFMIVCSVPWTPFD